MQPEFQRVAIINRGEAAMRFIHAAREFNHEHAARLCTIALFTEPDRHAMFVREADESVPLGSARLIDPDTGRATSGYADYGRLEKALAAARADAVWVGWDCLAEQADFAELCREMGIVFIGPDSCVMRRLGDRISAKLLAAQAQVPVAPWSAGPVETITDARRHAETIGLPFWIKPAAGSGGRGIRLVSSPDQLAAAFESARAEALQSFGNSSIFMERLIPGARHIEVQIIADHYGAVWAAGVRDCTIQRRYQKIIQESPSPALSSEQDQALRDAAVRFSRAAGYTNAGTVEFLCEPESGAFSFLEMNTGLPAGHPVTESTTGLDLVKLQIHVARGGRLEGEPPRPLGHAIEVRLSAEDVDNGFAPAPGVMERIRIPTGPGVRVDTGVAEGETVPAFDSLIANIVAWGQNRKEALARIERTLDESMVVIRGGTSNRAFLLELLTRAEVRHGEADVGWLDRLAAAGEHISRRYAEVALVEAAIETYIAGLAVEQTEFYVSALRGRPQVRGEVGRSVELRYRGHSYSMKTYCLGPRHYRVEAGGSRIDARIDRLGPFESWLTAFGRRFHIVSVAKGPGYQIEVDGTAHRIDRGDGGIVCSSGPAVVVSIAVKAGDTVSRGEPLAVLEAMKMEMQVAAPFAGKVRQVMTTPYMQVGAGTPLIQLDAAVSECAPADAGPVVFPQPAAGEECVSGDSHFSRNLEELRQLMLGFDVDPRYNARLRSASSHDGEASAASHETEQAEEEILNIFVDICSLFRRQPEVDDAVRAQGPTLEAYLFAYLRTLDRCGAGLPAAFLNALRRALAYYGVETLDRSPDLEQALLWIYKSHQRVEDQIAAVSALLERRLASVERLVPHAGESFRMLLDRLISATRDGLPAISDLARDVRYRYFDQPLFERARKQIYSEVEDHLAAVAECPEDVERSTRLRALVECPQPLVSMFGSRFAAVGPVVRNFMLEALTARHYRIRTLLGLRSVAVGSQSFVSAEYDHEGKRVHVFTAHAGYAGLPEVARAMFPLIEEVPADHDVVMDFYVWNSGGSCDPEETQNEIRGMLKQAAFPRTIRRIVVAVAGPGGIEGTNGLQHFTYRPLGGAYQEERRYRGFHPMMAKRLDLGRFRNFRLERLPSVEDVYLFHAVALDNPKDERLFACAEVRDLTPVRDAAGRIVQLPHLERRWTEALAGMRLFQSGRPAQERLYWNRVLLHVWPPLRFTPGEWHDVVHRLAPAADNLGLEQVVVRARIPDPETGELRDTVVRISSPGGSGLQMSSRPAAELPPLRTLTEYHQKVVRMRRRGLIYPYQIVKMLTPSLANAGTGFPPGVFTEYDLERSSVLRPVDRPYGQNKANLIVGVIRSFTSRYPEGMTRVMLLGDPSKDLGAIAEPECRRVIAALDLAEQMGVPLEWFAISAGAKISMESGVENMDWIARVLRRLIEYTQAGGEVNLVIDGINVGAQPYWNAEATMLMHTRGILIMTARAAMVLTGKRALDYSGSVSAEDNQGIGGYDRIMGLNGQAQYWARDIDEACHILMGHYEHAYVAPGERFARRALTTDPSGRDVRLYPHSQDGEDGFARVGDIFSDETNPGRKKPFDIRRVMMAAIDQDHPPLERWAGMRSADTAVVWDAHLGGYPVCLIGIESRPSPRFGFVPADGPDQWSAGTLFPQSSKKVARAINAASHNRPLVMLANLSGFDGSPESMRKLQLEYGAEIGRAVVNFKGPIVFCVISRYHGGAYVVFSKALNENLEVVALEGSYASVIGGAPAAAVVFSGEVEARARQDDRLQVLSEAITKASEPEKGRLRARWNNLIQVVRSEKLGEVADEFDRVHSVHRALQVGALDRIIPPADLRPYLIDAVERGMRKEMGMESLAVSPQEVGSI